MKRLDHFLAALGLQRANRTSQKGHKRYHAGSVTRLNSDWQPWGGTADWNISTDLYTLRERSRQLERDNDYFRRFLNSLENNVLGFEGINLQMKSRRENGRMDKVANMKIEEAWLDWGKKQFCTLTKEDSWCEVQKLVLRSTARDGGILIRHVNDDNPYGYSIELLEVDQLATTYHDQLTNGNKVFMGVEKDSRNRIVAYHVYNYHPGHRVGVLSQELIRIPREEIFLYYVKERVGQSVGVPWCISAMTRMHFLNKYEEAEVIAARAGAEKGGWFQSDRGDSFSGESEISEDENGNRVEQTYNDFEPNSYDQLPPGMTFHPYNPTHPNQAYGEFVKNTLYGIAAGLNVDYATLTNDLSQANYSSMRSGKLESQETWKGVQGHLIRNFAIEVFSRWLLSALRKRILNLPPSKFDQFNKPMFRGRRWPWVDPSKDVSAAIESINAGLDTRTNIIAQNGGDFEDNIETIKAENEMLADAGVKLGQVATSQEDAEDSEIEDEGEDDVEDSDEESMDESEEEAED